MTIGGYLLDSHAILWLLDADRKLCAQVAQLLETTELPVAASLASIWELEIKQASGKLMMKFDLVERLWHFKFDVLPITIEDAVAAARLPLIHRDPFDRMLIAQTQRRGLTLVTADRVLLGYRVPVLWAGTTA